jgi:hypothetical protein
MGQLRRLGPQFLQCQQCRLLLLLRRLRLRRQHLPLQLHLPHR